MIRFSLVCPDSHEFEGWFKSGAAFDEQLAAARVSCPMCGSTEIRKAVMAPAIARGREVATVPAAPAAPAPPPELARAAAARHLIRELRQHVERNFDHVGERFAEEARRIHNGETEKRDIWGQATASDARDLLEEGITVRPLPDLPELDG